MPQFVEVPGLDNAFADLDRLQTVEVGLLKRMDRVPGLRSDAERQRFAESVGRKLARLGYPDELTDTLYPWVRKVKRTHDRDASAEGRIFSAAEDVRVAVYPEWWADEIEIEIVLLMPAGWLPEPNAEPVTVGLVEHIGTMETTAIAEAVSDPTTPAQDRSHYVQALQQRWEEACTPTGSVGSVRFRLEDESEMSAAEYRATSSLDLEFLSNQRDDG